MEERVNIIYTIFFFNLSSVFLVVLILYEGTTHSCIKQAFQSMQIQEESHHQNMWILLLSSFQERTFRAKYCINQNEYKAYIILITGARERGEENVHQIHIKVNRRANYRCVKKINQLLTKREKERATLPLK
jgi:hypothetical protein